MDWIGYTAAALIGISLGLIGGGGSILTLPVMVYLFGINPLVATSYSLFVVGTTSLVGAFLHFRKGLISLRTGLLFGSVSVATVFCTRTFLVPRIPHELFQLGTFIVTQSLVTMLLFALLMLVAAFQMIRSQAMSRADENPSGPKRVALAGYGAAVGLVTGLLGIGGGFILIPALVLLLKLPMKQAIGTSLFIIALNSLMGFASDGGGFHINWAFLLTITTIAVAGIFFGGLMANRVPGPQLKKGFGWSILAVSVFIILKETVLRG
jgi:uncharacterized membrane protein YfcA